MKKLFLGIVALIGSFFAQPAKTEPKQPATLEQALKMGKVLLIHPKLKGGVSEHIATRNPALIPPKFAPMGVQENTPLKVNYFAVDIMEWRSFSTKQDVVKNIEWTFLG